MILCESCDNDPDWGPNGLTEICDGRLTCWACGSFFLGVCIAEQDVDVAACREQDYSCDNYCRGVCYMCRGCRMDHDNLEQNMHAACESYQSDAFTRLVEKNEQLREKVDELDEENTQLREEVDELRKKLLPG